MELVINHKEQEYLVIFDDDDAEVVSKYAWNIQINRSGVVYARGILRGSDSKRKFYMHRVLMNAPMNRLVDHKNGNGLDNRKCNLRSATRRQNAFNSRPMWKYKLKGIEFDKGRWAARMEYHGLRISLGRFDTKEEAAKAYDLVAIKLHGEYARLNFPEQGKAAEHG